MFTLSPLFTRRSVLWQALVRRRPGTISLRSPSPRDVETAARYRSLRRPPPKRDSELLSRVRGEATAVDHGRRGIISSASRRGHRHAQSAPTSRSRGCEHRRSCAWTEAGYVSTFRVGTTGTDRFCRSIQQELAPQSNSVALAPRLARTARWWVAGFGPGPECRASSAHLTPFGA